MTGPCDLVATGECCPGWDSATPEQQARASALEAQFIYFASGQQYGQCPTTVRPCGDDCNEYSTYWGPSEASSWTPMLTAQGTWINCRSGSCSCNPCNCCHICAINLEWPATGIEEVKIDGLVVDESEYFIYDDRKLVRREGCFPKCQNLQADSDAPGTFEVTYLHGFPLDVAGQAVLDTLACEFLKACLGVACGLPTRWRSISREGISIDQIDNFETLSQGRVGIFEVDQWLATVNPSGSMYKPYIPKMDNRQKLLKQTWP